MVRFVIDRGEWFVLEFEYVDSKGVRSRRVVSPCEVFGSRFLGLCLVRGDWRQFEFDRCNAMKIGFAFDQIIGDI
jgi:predicted DNA-binding transcriptional regulator YafY